MFIALTITGVLLMFYYVPDVNRAYQDIAALETNVRFGLLMRNLHRWTAHAMVILLFLHMMRVFYTGAYKPPREFNWVVGVTLLVLTLLLSFTGYLLPWDQLALWAVTVGHGIGGSTPYLGEEVQTVLFGGFEIGQPALLRFYTLHVLGLPLLAAIMMAVHFWRIRRDGGMARPL
jgi:quinol-cytochrome oxidoreductase complex cytochrome b subunit